MLRMTALLRAWASDPKVGARGAQRGFEPFPLGVANDSLKHLRDQIDGLGVFFDKNKCPGNTPRRVLPGGLLEKQVKRLAPAVESFPVVGLGQRFDLTHAPCL